MLTWRAKVLKLFFEYPDHYLSLILIKPVESEDLKDYRILVPAQKCSHSQCVFEEGWVPGCDLETGQIFNKIPEGYQWAGFVNNHNTMPAFFSASEFLELEYRSGLGFCVGRILKENRGVPRVATSGSCEVVGVRSVVTNKKFYEDLTEDFFIENGLERKLVPSDSVYHPNILSFIEKTR